MKHAFSCTFAHRKILCKIVSRTGNSGQTQFAVIFHGASSASHFEGVSIAKLQVRPYDQVPNAIGSVARWSPGSTVPPSWQSYCRCISVVLLQTENGQNVDAPQSVHWRSVQVQTHLDSPKNQDDGASCKDLSR